jgi:hypothetical protein
VTLFLVALTTETLAQDPGAAVPGTGIDKPPPTSERGPPPPAVLTAREEPAVVVREVPIQQEVQRTKVDAGDAQFVVQYGVQFLPGKPGQQAMARFRGPKDWWIGGELRLTPGSDLAWVGRASAGIDVLGKSRWDVDLGLSLGTAGQWAYETDVALLYASPVFGTEVGLGYDGKRWLAKYRWLGAVGAGPITAPLTEQEFTVGYRLLPIVQLYGQYLTLAPGELDTQRAVGLGARLMF